MYYIENEPKERMKMQLIDAEKLHLKLLDMEFPIQDQDAILDSMDGCMVDAAPATYGKWVGDRKDHCHCSLCDHGRNTRTQIGWNFCPNCGAMMGNA